MLILAIDTATPAVTAGVVRRDGGAIEVLASRVTLGARAHAEQLTPNAVGALADAEISVDDLDAVVVGCGPGPFTGLRVGMATAAAYGHALGLPVHGVCSLDAISIDTVGEVLVVTDARRREVYWARYRDGVRVDGPAVNAPADVPGADEALALPPGCTRPPRDWYAPSSTGPRHPRHWCPCICVDPTPNRRPSEKRRSGDRRLRNAEAIRRRTMRRTGIPVVLR